MAKLPTTNSTYETGSDDTFWNAKVIPEGARFSVHVYDADGDRRPERENQFEDEAVAIAFADKSVLRNPVRDKLFTGVYPCGLVYADRTREVDGDYARLAFLDYGTLVLEIADSCPDDLRKEITANAAVMQARQGEEFKISACNQTVTLGSRLSKVAQLNGSATVTPTPGI